MKTRNTQKRCKKFVRKTYDRNVSTIRVLWPMIDNLYGRSNDFLYVILKTIIANRGLNRILRVKQMIRGFFLKEKPACWENLSLALSPETNWFTSSSADILDIVGPILGYYLRTKADNFCQNLSPKWNPTDNFDDMDSILSICDNAVKPVVIEISAVNRTIERINKFVNVSDEILNDIKVNGLSNANRSGKVTVHRLRPEYYEWAWNCLKNGTVMCLPEHMGTLPSNLQSQLQLETGTAPKPITSSTMPSITKTRSGRVVNKRRFFE